MVSSFSNPGFPHVHTHPPTFSAMVAANEDSLRKTLDALFAPYLAKIRRARELALGTEGDSTPTPMIAISDGGDSDPASMCSEVAESIEVGHQKPQNGDSISLCIPSTIHDHSIPPILSSSPLLRALATPVVKPQSNDSVATTVLLLGSKNVIHDSVMTTTPLLFPISATFSTESAHAHSHKLVLSTTETTTMAHVLDFPLKNAGATESTGLSHTNTTKCRHEVLRSLISNLSHWKAKWHQLLQFLLAYHIGVIVVMYEDFLNDKFGWINWYLVGKFVKKDFHALELFDEMSKRERANVHVLSLMSYHMVKSIPSWHIFHDERKLEVMTCKALSDRYINLPALRITGGAPVIVALSSQDGTILSLIGIVSLEEWDAFNEVFRNCSSLLAMEATITVLKLMGLLMTNNGIVGSDRVVQAACAIVEAIETEVCELTLLNQKAAMVLQKLLSVAFSLNSSSQFCSDIRRKLENDFMISLQSVVRQGGELLPIRPLPWYPENHADFSVLFTSNLDFQLVWDPGDASAAAVKLMLYLQCKEGKRMGTKQSCFCSRQCGGDWHHEAMPSIVYWLVVRWVRTWEPPHESQYKVHNDKGEKHMNNPFDIQRLLQKLVVSWYIRYCYFAQLPTNNVVACSKSMTFWMNWEILLSAIWVLSAASPALFIVGQVDGSVQLIFGNRETLLYEIERYKESTSDEQLGCLAIQLHCSEFNLGTNNEINWAQEQKGACVIVALFLIVGTNVSIVQESYRLQHMVETLGLLNSFKSLRWMHQPQTTESKLMDQESETHNRPPSSVNLSVGVWGDVDGIEVCDIREWPPTSPLDHQLGKVVILREESYLVLGQANKEDGQLHQAQPVRLLLHGAISGALYAGHIHSLLQRECITESFLRGLSWLLRFIDKWIHSMDLENHKLNPRIEHYGCIVDLLSRANLFNVAEKFIRDMPTQPDVVIWGSLLFTCRIYGNIELAELVDKRTEVFEPQGAYVNSPRDAGSPLIWDVGHGHQDAVEVPLQNNANLVAENNDSITPLQSSVLVGSLPCLELLVHINHPNMRITPWEVVLILGQWVSDIKKDTKMPVYCALIKLLQDKDLSIRLAACRSLCLHSEDASFSEREFINLLPICWDSGLKLIKEVQQLDSKKAWDESANECLLQIQLLVAWRTAANWEDFHNSIFKP